MRRYMVLAALLASGVSMAGENLTVTIQRNLSCLGGETGGSLSINGREVARTLELPWRNNEEDISRVPAGSYPARIRQDGPRGWRIELMRTPDRENIQIHIGNYPKDTTGCVLVGQELKRINETCAVLRSREAISTIQTELQDASDIGTGSSEISLTVLIKD